MNKKIVGLLTALVIMSTATMTAFAADPSPSAKDTYPANTQEVTASNKDQKAETTVTNKSLEDYEKTAESSVSGDVDAEQVDKSMVAGAVDAVKEKMADLPNLVDEMKNKGLSAENAEKLADAAKDDSKAVDATILGVVNVEPKAGSNTNSFVYKDAAIKADSIILALHRKDDGTWEVVATKDQKDGEVTIVTDSFSPFAVSILVIKDKGAAATTAVKTAKTGKSPKTADALPVLPMLALACVAGAVVCTKKSRA